MKVSAFKRVVFWIFSLISFVGIMMLFAIDDVESEGLHVYYALCAFVIVSTTIAVLLYNYRVIFRHIFAINQIITLVYITVNKIRSRRYNYLYDAALKCGSLSKFYVAMLKLYDIVHKNVITVSNYYEVK